MCATRNSTGDFNHSLLHDPWQTSGMLMGQAQLQSCAEIFWLYFGGWRSLHIYQTLKGTAADQVRTLLKQYLQGWCMLPFPYHGFSSMPATKAETEWAIAGPTLDRDRWQWNSVTQMVLYGLGSPGKSAAARYPSGHTPSCS